MSKPIKDKLLALIKTHDAYEEANLHLKGAQAKLAEIQANRDNHQKELTKLVGKHYSESPTPLLIKVEGKTYLVGVQNEVAIYKEVNVID